mgnify:CR=1 FL=1
MGNLSAQPQQAQVGVYLMNLYDLNMDEHSFYADFYVWFKWKGDIDPTTIEFVNSIEKWSMAMAQSGDSSHMTLRDGTNYRIYRVEGRFFHSFSLNRFPLDEHVLDIQMESPEHPADSLVYVPDTDAAEIRNTLKLVGWETKGCRLETSIHDYGTNFGNPEENAQRYSNLTYTITLARPVSYFLLKMLLPLLVVMLVSIGGLLLQPVRGHERRKALGLLTQQGGRGAAALLLGLLDLLPLLVRGLAVLHDGVAVHVRVPADELLHGAFVAFGHAEPGAFAEQLETEEDEEAQVAEFLGGEVGVAGGDRVDGFHRLLGEVGRHGLQRLLAIPRAAVGTAQLPADAEQFLEGLALTFDHGAAR